MPGGHWTHPDAALIAASDEFCRTMDRLDACTYDAEPGSRLEVEAMREQEEVGLVLRAIAERMAGMRAVTHRGLAARAVAMGRADAGHANDHEEPDTTSRILLDALLCDGAAMTGMPLVGANADTELLALRPEYTRLKAEYDARNAGADPWVEDAGAEFDEFCMRVIAMPPARTAAGRAFKAQLALDQFVYIEGGGQADAAIRTVLDEVVAAGRIIS